MRSQRERSMKLRGDGINVNRYRKSKNDDSKITQYLDVQGDYTLAELLEFLADLGIRTGTQLEDVRFSGGCFVLTSDSTEEDRERWKKTDERLKTQAAKSRRDWYEKLKEEFEPDEA